MTSKEQEVLINIIGAVESGGQIYGNRNYAAYAPPYHASSEEHTITLGWAQFYGGNANKLLNKIYKADPSVVSSSLVSVLNKDWVATRWNPTSSQKQSLISAITSTAGKKCQDELFIEITEPVIKEAEKYSSDAGVQIMYVEIAHLGGNSAAKRIFNKATKPYTVDGIFNTLMLDQKDTSNNNQVGDKIYQSRHECCVKWIKQYLSKTTTTTTTTTTTSNTKTAAINALIATAKAEIGYLEKKSNANLDNKTANAGSGNYTKYWRDVYPSFQTQPWCACFVSWCMMKTFGLETAKKLLKHWPYVYCPTLGSLFTKNANPKVGDIVIFYRNGEFAHTGLVIDVQGDLFTTIEGNTSSGSTIIPNGGGVCQKQYYNSNLPGTKFCTPDYSIVTNVTAPKVAQTTQTTQTTKSTPKAWSGITTKKIQARTWAGDTYPEVSFSPLNKGVTIEVQYSIKDSKGAEWYYFKTKDNKYAFIPANSVEKSTADAPSTQGQYRVQSGSFTNKANAEKQLATVKAAGIDAILVKTAAGSFVVQLGVFSKLANANSLKKQAEKAGVEVAIVKL